MKNIFLIKLLFITIIISSCGKGTVEVENMSYEPKIVIEGLLIAGQKVDKIKIARNFKIDANLRQTNLIPNVARTIVSITDIEADKKYFLSFFEPENRNFDDYCWEYNYDDLKIECGKSYRLDVSAFFEGRRYVASSTTTVPQEGFNIVDVNYDSMTYRQKDANDNIERFSIAIQRSPGISMYLTIINALSKDESLFIYDNPYEEYDREDVLDELNGLAYELEWIQNTPTTVGESSIEIWWNDIWFYDDYNFTVYAVDKNYMQFLQTYNDVQEPDGNFHEAKFNIEGDGIGYFGSAIADTISVKVLKK